ncbi:MAG: histidine phosphatase family protein, partial [Chitinophagaceae bacterium]
IYQSKFICMKSLLLIRHAKSSWDSPTLKDFDRSLNERGHKDAALMAGRLLESMPHLDAFISSSAVRAATTAEYFQKAYKAFGSGLILKPELYHAQPATYHEVIQTLNDDWKSVAIFSHNPGITEIVNSFNVAKVVDMPTCAIFGVTAEVKLWKDFVAAEKHFLMFDYPKI